MKDKDRIMRLERLLDEKPFRDLIDRGESVIKELRGITIKDCPKCKHRVLALNLDEVYSNNTCVLSFNIGSGDTRRIFQCLTCGSKFTCSNECVYKLLED